MVRKRRIVLNGSELRAKRSYKVYTEEEERCIINYMKDTVTSGYSIETPSAKEYYIKLINDVQLKNVTHAQLYDKVRSFMRTYRRGLEWSKNAGEAVKENEGEVSFQAKREMMFPHYTDLHEIWCEKSNVLLPYVSTSEGELPQGKDVEECLDINQVIMLETGEDSNSRSDSVEVDVQDDETVELHEDDDFANVDTSDIFAIDSRKTEECLRKRRKSNAVPNSTFLEVTKMREDNDKKKLELQRQQLELDQRRIEGELELSRERFEFDKELKRKECTIKMDEIQSNERIKMKEFEVRSNELKARVREKELEVEALTLKLKLRVRNGMVNK